MGCVPSRRFRLRAGVRDHRQEEDQEHRVRAIIGFLAPGIALIAFLEEVETVLSALGLSPDLRSGLEELVDVARSSAAE